jgi:signal transduction histidine kinase
MLFRVLLIFILLNNFLVLKVSGISQDDIREEQSMLPGDKKKITGLISKASYLASHKNDSCVIYAIEGMRLARANNDMTDEAAAIDILSNYYFDQEQYREALNYLNLQVSLYTNLGDSLKKAQTYNLAGLSEYYLGDFENAVRSYHHAIQLGLEQNDNRLLAKIYQNVGILYAELNMTAEAMGYYQKALDLHRLFKNKDDEAGILQNIGIIYSDEKKYRDALGYYLSALKIYKELKDSVSVALMYLNLGSLYEDQNNLPRALAYYKSSLASFQKSNYKLGLAYSYISLGSVYKKTGAYNKALDFLQLSLKYSKLISLMENEIDCHRELAEVYSGLKDYKSAYDEMHIYSILYDSIYNENVHQQVAEMETRINAKIKDKEIANLKKEREKAVRDMVRRTIVSIVIVTLTLIIIVVIFYYSRSLKKAKNNLEDRVIERTSELEKAKIKAEESDRLKSAFIANMSHEIRTPLNAITGFAGLLLKENVPSDKRDEYYDQITQNNKILIKMIEDLIDTSKIESGSLQLHPSQINIEHFLNQFIEPVAENMARLNKPFIDIVADKPDIKTKLLVADAVRLQQVLWHFLDNAVKFTNRGSIHFGCREEDHQFIFYVRDTGIGIPEEYNSVIFDKFRQLDASSKRKSGGTGLGLYYAKKIAEVMEGRIWFESKEKSGSIFYFALAAKN